MNNLSKQKKAGRDFKESRDITVCSESSPKSEDFNLGVKGINDFQDTILKVFQRLVYILSKRLSEN